MLLAIAFAVLKAQVAGPVLPPACSPRFQSDFFSVEEALQSEDFQKAEARLKLLPKSTFSIVWDDSKVPSTYRSSFRQAGEDALRAWKGHVRGLNVAFASKGEVRISFEPVLANRPGSKLPASRVGFFGEDPSSPGFDFVIGLKRGSPLLPSEQMDVFNDVAYCVGSYLGVADSMPEVGVMGPSDLRRMNRATISGPERGAAQRNLVAVSELEKAAQKHISVIAAKPGMFLDPLVINGEPAIQGDRVEFHLQLSNRGDSPLAFMLFPECGCTIVTDPGTVKPQSTRMIAMAIDTRTFTSDITKSVTVYTNDPVTPVQVVTLKVKVRPRYRVFGPAAETIVVPDGGMKVPIYLIPAPGSDLEPLSTTFDGFVGTTVKVSFSPWNGILADPERHEGPMMRKGFKFVLDIKGHIKSGRNPGTLQIFTSNADFPDITYPIYAQNGIIALPDDLFLGEVGHVPVTREIILSRPGAPFKVLDMSSNSENLTVSMVPSRDPGDYRLAVHYDGKGHPGQLLASIRVHTSDPKQPFIDVPVRASIQ